MKWSLKCLPDPPCHKVRQRADAVCRALNGGKPRDETPIVKMLDVRVSACFTGDWMSVRPGSSSTCFHSTYFHLLPPTSTLAPFGRSGPNHQVRRVVLVLLGCFPYPRWLTGGTRPHAEFGSFRPTRNGMNMVVHGCPLCLFICQFAIFANSVN